jgi:cell division FtsZ-interacting protein ZapD
MKKTEPAAIARYQVARMACSYALEHLATLIRWERGRTRGSRMKELKQQQAQIEMLKTILEQENAGAVITRLNKGSGALVCTAIRETRRTLCENRPKVK